MIGPQTREVHLWEGTLTSIGEVFYQIVALTEIIGD